MNSALPCLKFPLLKQGRSATPWDISSFLYMGGANTDRKLAAKLADRSELGQYQPSRLDLVEALHDEITAGLVGGARHATVVRQLISLRVFFKWLDACDRPGSVESAERDFLDWAEALFLQQTTHERVKQISLYSEVSTVGGIFERVLGLKSSLLHRTRIRKPKNFEAGPSAKSDREEINETFRFGRLLLDICEGLSLEKIRGELPLMIKLTGGAELEEWSGLVNPSKVKALECPNSPRYKSTMRKRDAWSADTSMRTRRPLVNLRIQAELLIFIAQTGMNLAQAYQLSAGHFSYRSHYDGYQIRRVYKDRRKGDVEFEIFSSYREYFERYLEWRSAFFPCDSSSRLFPLESPHQRSENIAPEFGAIEKRCARVGIEYIGPRMLRKSRQNWLLRRSDDVELTAQMGQHTASTLLKYYIRPNHQLAMKEVSQFHSLNDPTISPPGPGMCVQQDPSPMPMISDHAPEPDCANPSGCLFCMHHRDLDSFDYVWSLASYRHLKIIELSMTSTVPLQANSIIRSVVSRLTAKIEAIARTHERAAWIQEAQERIWESNFHPKWDGFIQLMEPASP